jgi:ferric-dicitrate binding protein FerR (iron transport regulator)
MGRAKLSRLERESLSWVNRLHSGAFSVEDADAFRRWRSSDPANEAAFVEAIRFRRRVGEMLRSARQD